MKTKELMAMLNEILRSPWSEEEARAGKNIQCMPSWVPAVREIVPMYTSKGWIVEKRVSISSRGRQLSLNFKHPSWSKK